VLILRLALGLLFILAFPAFVDAATGYASSRGSGTTCSNASPCDVATLISQMQPGDVGILKGNTMAAPSIYQGANYLLRLPIGKSGSVASPLTFRCDVPGGCLVDGEFIENPFSLADSSDIVVEDINFRNGKSSVLNIRKGSATRITIRRVVAWDARADWNGTVCSPHGGGIILYEDVACFGMGRKIFSNSQAGDNQQFTCRRCWGRFEGSINVGPKLTFSFVYNSRNFKCENCIAFWSGESMPQSYTMHNNGVVWTGDWQAGHWTDFTVPNSLGLLAMDHLSHGNVANRCVNVDVNGSLALYRSVDRYRPGPRPLRGVYFVEQNRGGMDCYRLRHVYVYVGHPVKGFLLGDTPFTGASATNITSIRPGEPGDSFGSGWAVTSQAVATAVSGAPSPWTATATGANLCKRWSGDTATNAPLWPWPMNDRIKAATAMAGPYSGPCPTCVGGRLARRETDVTAIVEAVLGEIPAKCRQD
jgi:hypothetical protein